MTLTTVAGSGTRVMAWKWEGVANLRRGGISEVGFFKRRFWIVGWRCWLLVSGLGLIRTVYICNLRSGETCGRGRSC